MWALVNFLLIVVGDQYILDTVLMAETQVGKGCFWGYIGQTGVKWNYYSKQNWRNIKKVKQTKIKN